MNMPFFVNMRNPIFPPFRQASAPIAEGQQIGEIFALFPRKDQPGK
jgi:hypothetical protein